MEIRGGRNVPIDFVAVGHLAVDLQPGERVLGGAAAYGALTAARLGRATAVVTAVGADFDLFGPLEGIEVHYHLSPESTTFRNEYRGTHREQHVLGRARSLAAEDLRALRARVSSETVIFYCPIAREVDAPLVPFEPGGMCGVAAQGFFRTWDDAGTVRACAWEGAEAALDQVTLVSLSVADAPASRELARKLARGDRVVALTEGEDGARVYTQGRCFRIPAWPSSVREPTGAGDVFAASFLVALTEGRDPLDAAQFAACAAAFAVEAPGVSGVFKSRADVETRLADYRTRYRRQEIEP